jgi:hypothetical protein
LNKVGLGFIWLWLALEPKHTGFLQVHKKTV